MDYQVIDYSQNNESGEENKTNRETSSIVSKGWFDWHWNLKINKGFWPIKKIDL